MKKKNGHGSGTGKKRRGASIAIAALCIGALVFLGIWWVQSNLTQISEFLDPRYDGYVRSETAEATLYTRRFAECGSVVRGTAIEVHGSRTRDDGEKYYEVEFNGERYYMLGDNITVSYADSVVLSDLYVRTPVTLYISPGSSRIAGYAPKGALLSVSGFNGLIDGEVEMYRVDYGDASGFVYAKYLVGDSETALAVYGGEEAAPNYARGNSYGGGDAAGLDYYPVEKPVFEDNPMPDEVRSLYLNCMVLGDIDAYIELARGTGVNAFVVDIKEELLPGYPADAMQQYSPTSYAHAQNSYEDYRTAIRKLLDAGFYVIGRITVFKDSYYIADHPECAITDTYSGAPYLHNGSYWPSAYSRGVWQYTLALAEESVLEMGFNEIQFDYIRFPDRLGDAEASGRIDLHNIYGESRAQAIQNFLFYACDSLHRLGAYVSCDVFGESAYNYVTAYGQYWPAMSNVADAISAMPYPDHFNAYEFGSSVPVWTVPEFLSYNWGLYAAARQTEIPTPAVARTWLQVYNSIREPYVYYGLEKVAEQISGLYRAGLCGGYITWCSWSGLDKYAEVIPAFSRTYG